MTIVNFSITEPLAEKINRVIKEWGFSSKAEFFRFIAISFVERSERKKIMEDFELAASCQNLEETVNTKFKGKQMPSLESQFSDLL